MDNVLNKALQLKNKQQFKQALRLLLKEKVQNKERLFLIVQLHNDLEQFSQAILVAKRLLSEANNHSVILNTAEKTQLNFFIGVCYKNIDNKFEAIQYLENSIELVNNVDNASAIYHLAFLYLSVRNITKFELLAEKLIKWQEFFLNTQLLLIDSAVLQQNVELIKKRVLNCLPYAEQLTPQGFGKLGGFLIDFNLEKELDQLINRYEKVKPMNGIGLKAKWAFNKRKYDSVINLLPDDLLTKINNPALYYLIADTYDKKKAYSKAYQYYQKGCALKKQTPANMLSSSDIKIPVGKHFKELVLHQEKVLSNQDVSIFPIDSLVFVIGFPRSGTTLVDNVLDTQEHSLVFSEAGVFKVVLHAFKQRLILNNNKLNKFTDEQLDSLRQLYFDTIDSMGFNLNDYKLIVEKDPHYLHCIPLIKLLFPSAKIVLCQRNPLDVCISCFQKDFIDSEENRKLLSLDSIIKQYIEHYKTIASYSNALDIEFYQIKYEDIIKNFDNTFINFFDYLNFKADESFKTFNKHASTKYVTSASRGQTNQAIYANAQNKWYAYKEQLEPYLAQVAPMMQNLGYKIK